MQKKQPKTIRVRPKEVSEAIWRPRAEVKGDNTHTAIPGQVLDRVTECFTMLGKQETLDFNGYPQVEDEEHKDVLAKIVIINAGTPSYMIKRDAHGRFFNPMGIDEGRHNKFIHRAGKDKYEFKSVSSKTFRFYIDFLKTKNLAHLRNAERENF